MNCLVLGGAGFIGSHVVDGLVARGHRVRVLDRPAASRRNLEASLGAIDFVAADFASEDQLAAALEGIEIVVHLAGTTLPASSNEDPVYDVESNVVATLGLLRRAVDAGVRKIVFASSGGTVYGVPERIPTAEEHPTNPICAYGISKLAIEKYLGLYHHLHGLDHVVLRMANPYGERQSIRRTQGAVAVFLGRTLRDKEITIWGDGSVARDYFHVHDLVAAFLTAIEGEPPSRVYNIGGGRSHTLEELLALIREVTGRSPRVRYAPGRRLDVPISCLDISRAARELGWSPEISLRQGIARVWEWLLVTGGADPRE